MRNLLVLLAGLILLAGTPVLPVPVNVVAPTSPATPAPTKATAAVYVYEKDESAIPAGVTSGINKLNREKKIVATLFERDTVDGGGRTPTQYAPALEAAKRESIPALVVLSGTAVVKVVKAPKTEDDVFAAVQ